MTGAPEAPQWLGDLIHDGLEATVVFDGELRVIYANRDVLKILGYRWEDIAGVGALELVHPDDADRAATSIVGVTQGARPDPGLIKVRTAAGEWRPVEVNPRTVRLPDPPDGPGEVVAVTLRDHQLEDTHWRFLADMAAGGDLRQGLEALARGLSSTADGPLGISFQVNGERLTVGPLGEDLTWPDRLEELDPWRQALNDGQPAWKVADALPEPLRAMALDQGIGVLVVVPVPDPAHGLPALLVQGPAVAAMAEIHSIALSLRPRQALSIALERRHALARLHHLAHHDPLTGLANRSAFFDRLAGHHANGLSLGVCFIDLDGFKAVNDSSGHQTGDEVLRRVAATLCGLVGPDDLVARLGGDEFGIAVGGANETMLGALAEAITSTLRDGVELDGVVHPVGASVGAAVGDVPPDSVVAAADAAMYEAKRAGRRTWRMAAPVSV